MAPERTNAQTNRNRMMERFEVHILGCGSALPTTRHGLSSQVVNHREKLYMIDCGEGSQLRFRAEKLKFQKLAAVFISHLHGDHCFGLPGLIATLGMLGRTGDLLVFAQPDAEPLFRPLLDYFCKELPYRVIFQAFDPARNDVLYEDRSLKVSTIPLKHRVPSAGFLFEEKASLPSIRREMVDFYQIPVSQIAAIKQGADFVTSEGTHVPHRLLTRPPAPACRYAYCSDTAYHEKIIPIIEGVDLLYHEATFINADRKRARETGHSSAEEAARIAKAAHVKRLVLGHFSARYPDETVLLNEAQAIFPQTVLANERMLINLVC